MKSEQTGLLIATRWAILDSMLMPPRGEALRPEPSREIG